MPIVAPRMNRIKPSPATMMNKHLRELRAAGARFQKPLWASTSTKDPSYRDVMYVEPLIGPSTVNTLPDATVEAFRDHGEVALTVEDDLEVQQTILDRLGAIGIDIDEVTETLERLRRMSVPIIGLMAIPPLTDDPEGARQYFVKLRELRDTVVAEHPGVAGLSMGMTNDFEIAVAEGATVIRVGRAIFQD